MLDNREGTIEKILRKIHELGQQAVQFATFPETVVPYYPYFSFVQSALQNIAGPEQRKLLDQAVTVPYRTALNVGRQELRSRLASMAFGHADALIFPTTPCAAPQIGKQWNFQVIGKDVTDMFPVPEHISHECRRRARNQSADATELGWTSTRRRGRCSRRSRP